MATGNTTLLGLALPVEGELDGTWGDVVNDSITSLVDSAIAGTTTLSTDADVTLTTTSLAANQARQAILRWAASNGATTRNITAPAQSKPYIVINDGTGSVVLRGAGPTTGITIASGEKTIAAWNGSDFVRVAGDVTLNGVQTLSNKTFTTLAVTGGAVIQGLTAGRGASAIADNTAFGVSALAAITTGLSNTAIGWQSSKSMVQGYDNTGCGLNTLRDTLNGYANTAVGTQALQANTQGYANTAVGNTALISNLTGFGNVAVGYAALGDSTGNSNTGVGTAALGDTTGAGNTAVGNGAGQLITTGSNNVVIGGYTGSAAPISATGNNWIVLSDGAGSVRQAIDSAGNAQFSSGAVVVYAPAPTAISTTATLTNANIQNQIITASGSSYTIRMPVGTTLETLVSWSAVNLGYDFFIINTGSGNITLDATETGVTSVGRMIIDESTSAQFRIRRTAANTFIVYRLA